MELTLSNISNYNISNITTASYFFSNITPGDPYRVVADVYDNLDFQHILTNVVLGNAAGYIWPVDDISGLDFGIELADDISFEIKKEYIRPDEIPVFIHCNISDPSVSNYVIRFDLYAEPLVDITYKPHTKKKFVSNEISEFSDHLIKYYLSDLDMLVPYNVYYSLKVKPPDTNEWKYVTAHTLIDTNVTTIDPGFHVELRLRDHAPIDKLTFVRAVGGYFVNRHLTYHVREYRVEDLYDNMKSAPVINNVHVVY
jgi:hypothetical protein